ncbi:hypothetical protein D3C85_1707700 [compost metagenome]
MLTAAAQCSQHIQRTDAAMKLAHIDITVGVEHTLIVLNDLLVASVKDIEHDGAPRRAAEFQCLPITAWRP